MLIFDLCNTLLKKIPSSEKSGARVILCSSYLPAHRQNLLLIKRWIGFTSRASYLLIQLVVCFRRLVMQEGSFFHPRMKPIKQLILFGIYILRWKKAVALPYLTGLTGMFYSC